MLYDIVYRTGGTLNARWHRVLGRYTEAQASARKAEIERMGYKALVAETGWWDDIGLPDGWEA